MRKLLTSLTAQLDTSMLDTAVVADESRYPMKL